MNSSKKILSDFAKTFFSLNAPSFRGIYLDFQATTPIDPRVLDVMLPYQVGLFANPHSNSHEFGLDVGESVEIARNQVGSLINAPNPSHEIIFTSGATESNNLALKGVCSRGKKAGKNHIITTSIEHKCVIEACKYLEKEEGIDVTYLGVDENGLICLDELESSIRDDTMMVSVMYVNNEVGVMQDLHQIGSICQSKDVLLHTDAAQALGKIPIDVSNTPIDLMSMSSHKAYGPKGIGGLYVKQKKPRTRLDPIISGGGQERGLRSGTLPSFLCIGFGAACEIAEKELVRDEAHYEEMFWLMHDLIFDGLDDVYLNGDLDQRFKGNINISFGYVEGESLMLGVKDEAYVSSGSACTSEVLEPSYVLTAMNVDDSLSHTSIRFGIGRFTTEDEIRYVARRLIEEVERLRALSPLYDMAKRGIDISSIEWDDDHHH